MCGKYGCRELVNTAYCAKHQQAMSQAYDARRGTPSARGYNRKWVNARAAYLRTHSLCEECKKTDRLTKAECVDHIIPHQGDMQLFWDSLYNWQALCRRCHSAKTMKETNDAKGKDK